MDSLSSCERLPFFPSFLNELLFFGHLLFENPLSVLHLFEVYLGALHFRFYLPPYFEGILENLYLHYFPHCSGLFRPYSSPRDPFSIHPFRSLFGRGSS